MKYLLQFLLLSFLPVLFALPSLQSSHSLSTDGHYVLSWPASPQTTLLELKNGKWTIIYRGADTSTTVSGKPNGQYQYRLENSDSDSPVLTVQVVHHSLRNALLFFGTGAFVFILTLLLITRGHRRE